MLHTAKHSFVRSPGFRLHTDEGFCRITILIGIYFWKSWETEEKPIYISLILPYKLFSLNIPISVLKKLNYFPIKHRIILIWLRGWLVWSWRKKWSKFGFIFLIFYYLIILKIFNLPFLKKTMRLKWNSQSQLFKTYCRIFSLLFKRNNNI